MGNKTVNRRGSRRVAAVLAALGALVMSSGVALMATAGPSNAAECVPTAAYTETINHPAVTHVVHHDAVPAVDSQWWNFAPNREQGPLASEPAFPTDPRGTWEGPHADGGPGQDQVGTFQSGDGHGSWFHRTAAVAAQAAYDETVTDTAAWTETVNHAAVTCETVSTPTGGTVSTPTGGAVEGTTVVSPPKAHVKAKAKTHTHAQAATVTPTVVEAGLLSSTTQDLRGEQGLALIGAGMVMLIGAGGLTLRVRRSAVRI